MNWISSNGPVVRRGLIIVLLAALVGGALVGAGVGSASGSSDRGGTPTSSSPGPDGSPVHFHNPIRDGLTGAPLSCPDPTAIRYKQGPWNYYLVCTSDTALNGFSIWKSIDLVHWYPDGTDGWAAAGLPLAEAHPHP